MKRFFSSPQFIISSFIIFTLLFFLYSFTQIDLSLTVSRVSLFQQIEKAFQYIGYFNRPLATELFFFIVIGLFVSYLFLLEQIEKRKLSTKTVLLLISSITILLLLAYNAFSYDLFNYIFDAKIFTQYHENPYMHKALDYPQDPMLSFMRWTHRVYPYGPIWLALTVPLSYLGLQKFILTFFLFKLLMAAAFAGTVYILYLIGKELFPSKALLAAAFFAFNPLVLTENLVSAHNDIVMMFLAVAALFFLVRKQVVLALLLLLLSIGIKFATVFLVPVFIYAIYKQYRKETVNWEKVILIAVGSMITAVVAASVRTNFQPWYLLYVLPFASLVAFRKAIFHPVVLVTITALFNYAPYLFTGNWDPPIPAILMNLNLSSAIIAFGIGVYFYAKEKKVEKHA